MSVGALSIAKAAPTGRRPFHIRPRVWILFAAMFLVVSATLYVMANDHAGLGPGRLPSLTKPPSAAAASTAG